MTPTCVRIRGRLSAYLDGELDGAGRLLVSRHLGGCQSCVRVLQDLRDVGDLVRTGSTSVRPPADLAGLASGVISRARAEDSQSWRAMLRQASDGWHWALVGGGSLFAAMVSVLLVAVICGVSARRERSDSLAALLNNLRAPAGTLWILATPLGPPNQAPMLMQLGSDGTFGGPERPMALPAGFTGPSGDDLAFALSEAVVRPDGRVVDLRSMSRRDRQHTEAILGEIQRQRALPLAVWFGQRVRIQRLGLVTNTNVTGKAL